jgi:endoglucanase
MILLPGTDYTAVGSYIPSGSASALSDVVNLDGSYTDLIFDVHQYLDSGTSGTSPVCANNGVTNLDTLAIWLRSNKRQA